MPNEELDVEVVYARAEVQRIVTLRVPPGTTAGEAVRLSGLLEEPGETSPQSRLAIGVHGRTVSEETVLAAGDRVEIYRPLVADPKHARRRRARA